METSEILRNLRINAGLDQHQLSKISGIGKSNVYKLEDESNFCNPKKDTLVKWVNATMPVDKDKDSEATKRAEWLRLSIGLVIEDLSVLSNEGSQLIDKIHPLKDEPSKEFLTDMIPNWVKGLIPMKFCEYLAKKIYENERE